MIAPPLPVSLAAQPKDLARATILRFVRPSAESPYICLHKLSIERKVLAKRNDLCFLPYRHANMQNETTYKDV